MKTRLLDAIWRLLPWRGKQGELRKFFGIWPAVMHGRPCPGPAAPPNSLLSRGGGGGLSGRPWRTNKRGTFNTLPCDARGVGFAKKKAMRRVHPRKVICIFQAACPFWVKRRVNIHRLPGAPPAPDPLEAVQFHFPSCTSSKQVNEIASSRCIHPTLHRGLAAAAISGASSSPSSHPHPTLP